MHAWIQHNAALQVAFELIKTLLERPVGRAHPGQGSGLQEVDARTERKAQQTRPRGNLTRFENAADQGRDKAIAAFETAGERIGVELRAQ